MEKFKGYENAKVITTAERLPVDGYVCKIMNATEAAFSNGGKGLRIDFDIAEGEFKDYYANNYRAQKEEDKKWKGNIVLFLPKGDGSEQDGWTADKFKTSMDAIENSNKGFHWDWDESKLKGKKIGVLFQDKEYAFNGKTGFFTSAHSLRIVQDIKDKKFSIPKPKLLPDSQRPVNLKVEAFEEILSDDDLPF